jgi:hypothetical protein
MDLPRPPSQAPYLPFRCAEKLCARHLDELRKFAQHIHQAYHYDETGTWETCSRVSCTEIRDYLEKHS